jgi:hypothetical protein
MERSTWIKTNDKFQYSKWPNRLCWAT